MNAANTSADPASRLASRVVRSLAPAVAVLSCLAAAATELTPSRHAVLPGTSVRIAVHPPLDPIMPTNVRLFLSSSARNPQTHGIELRIAEWRGDSLVAVIPCHARFEQGPVPLLLIREVDAGLGHRVSLVIAESGRLGRFVARNSGLTVNTDRGASCAGRLKPDPQARSATRRDEAAGLSRRLPANELPPQAAPGHHGMNLQK